MKDVNIVAYKHFHSCMATLATLTFAKLPISIIHFDVK